MSEHDEATALALIRAALAEPRPLGDDEALAFVMRPVNLRAAAAPVDAPAPARTRRGRPPKPRSPHWLADATARRRVVWQDIRERTGWRAAAAKHAARGLETAARVLALADALASKGVRTHNLARDVSRELQLQGVRGTSVDHVRAILRAHGRLDR